MIRGRARIQSGQAMTEFIVVVSAVVLPLFVLVPMLGKWIHTGFAADMAGRYANWERTVWFDTGATPDGAVDEDSLAEMSQATLEKTALTRFFGGQGEVLHQTQVEGSKLKPGEVDGLHTTLDGDGLFVLADMQSTESQDGTPDELDLGVFKITVGPYDVLEAFNTAVDFVLTPFDWLGITDGFGRINHTFKGYFVSSLSVPLNRSGLSGQECGLAGGKAAGKANGCEGGHSDIAITTYGAIIADGWNAQNDAHFRDRVDDFALGTMLNNEVIETVGEVLDFELFGVALEPTIGGLLTDGFGRVGIKEIPEGLPECNLLAGVCHYYHEPD
ncbi:MAG: hypothetical protein ACI89D_000680 [Bermanella sp.]|jgi:hypothetical protein